jgi:hypothetical protein
MMICMLDKSWSGTASALVHAETNAEYSGRVAPLARFPGALSTTQRCTAPRSPHPGNKAGRAVAAAARQVYFFIFSAPPSNVVTIACM